VARVQQRVITIRVTDEVIDTVRAFATRHNMMNKEGEPNVSEAARVLLFMAMRQVGPEGLNDVYLNNARAEWMEMVNGAFRAAMREISKIGLGE